MLKTLPEINYVLLWLIEWHMTNMILEVISNFIRRNYLMYLILIKVGTISCSTANGTTSKQQEMEMGHWQIFAAKMSVRNAFIKVVLL